MLILPFLVFFSFVLADLPGTWPPKDIPPPEISQVSIQWQSSSQATIVTQCSSSGLWAMTFSDGPSVNTATLLTYLKSNNIKVTFFVVGSRVIENYQILRQAQADGHQIAIQGWSNTDLTTLSPEQVVSEILWCIEAVQQAIGKTPMFFRPPFGKYNDQILQIVNALSLNFVLWGTGYDTTDSVAYSDDLNVASALLGISDWASNAKLENIISLQHDTYPEEVVMATKVGQMALDSGTSLVLLSNCVAGTTAYFGSQKNFSIPYKQSSLNVNTNQVNTTTNSSTNVFQDGYNNVLSDLGLSGSHQHTIYLAVIVIFLFSFM